MGLDFFGVTLAGQIETFPGDLLGGSKIVDLWVDNQTGAFEEDLGAMSFVSQINVEQRLGYTSKIQLVLTPPYEEGLKFLNSTLIHFGVGRLFVQFGYSTGTATSITNPISAVHSGLLQKPSVRIGNDIVITMNAIGVGYAMNITGGSNNEKEEFSGLSHAGAVEKVLSRYAKKGRLANESALPDDDKAKLEKSNGGMLDLSGLYADFSDTDRDKTEGAPFFRNPPTVEGVSYEQLLKETEEERASATKKERKKIKDPPIPKIMRGPRNDWWFVREVIENHGLQTIFEGDKVRITDQSKWMAAERDVNKGGAYQKPRKHFLMRGEVVPHKNMFPILTFNSPTTAVWMAPGVGRIVAADISRDKRSESKNLDGNNVKYSQTDTGVVNPDASSTIADTPQDASKNIAGDPRDAATIQKAKAEWKKMQMDSGVTGIFNTVGIPDLTPGEIIEVSGFQEFGQSDDTNKFFNGPYGVIEVRHSVGVGGFTTRFRGVKNWFPLGHKNTMKPKEGRTAEASSLSEGGVASGPGFSDLSISGTRVKKPKTIL